ncbi:MAG: HAMP domain-containing protein, partial [Deltaproteobacteria bacterium]|nr:HAMP domain-containing protein [Deltaproteobacteria bacterium]
TRIWTAIIATITLVCIVSILYLLAKKIIVPLDLVTLATKDISRGDLSITVPTNPHSCLEELGQALNDLTANFQEVLLFTGTTAANSRSSVEKIEKALESRGEKPDDELLEQIRGVTQDLETLGSMVEAFTFYQARFDGQTVIGELCPDKDSDIGRLQSRLELTLKRKPAGPAGKQPTERDLE